MKRIFCGLMVRDGRRGRLLIKYAWVGEGKPTINLKCMVSYKVFVLLKTKASNILLFLVTRWLQSSMSNILLFLVTSWLQSNISLKKATQKKNSLFWWFGSKNQRFDHILPFHRVLPYIINNMDVDSQANKACSFALWNWQS